MFTAIILPLAAFASVSALVVPRATPPAGWLTDILESYDGYHKRYLAIGCQNKHGQPFFDLCCHPLLATEKLAEVRESQCIPSTSTSGPTSAPSEDANNNQSDDDNDDDEDCDDNDDNNHSDNHSTPAVTPSHTPTSTPKATPKTSSTQAKPTPTSKPNVDSSTTSSNALGLITGGFATFFYQGGVAGACGKVHSDNDLVAAMDYRRYGDLGAVSSLCGKKVKITNPANQQSVTVTVADACPTCNNANSIDLSLAAFKQIAALDQGLVKITWNFV